MPSFHPRAQDLPQNFPVFPLTGALLLPQGRLPLNIFEPRYLAMVEDALGQGRMFGMIQPDASRPAGETGPALFRVGCLGRLSSFSETEDGRYLITLTGIVRFGAVEELEMRRGYRRVRASFKGFLDDLDLSPHPVGVGRERLLAALRGYFTAHGFEANWDAIRQIPDETLIGTLCMVCPFGPAEKQALLEAQDPAERGRALLSLLQIGSHDAEDGRPDRPAS
jgi:uncharacterized protein